MKLIARNGHECNGAIIGMLLGDSHLHRSKPSHNTRLQTKHSKSSEDYLVWKKDFLSPYLGGEIQEEFQKGDGDKWKDRYAVKWVTPVERRLNYHHQDFYPKGLKIVKKSVLNRLTPLGLAIWHGDDGSLHLKNNRFMGIVLSTEGFDDLSLRTIVQWFEESLGLKFGIQSDRRVHSDVGSGWRFLAIVKPYLDHIPSMRHKVEVDRILHYAELQSFKSLPEWVKERLQLSNQSIPTRGYVFQVFPKSALWPLRLCLNCATPVTRVRSQYCSSKCYVDGWYANKVKDIVRHSKKLETTDSIVVG